MEEIVDGLLLSYLILQSLPLLYLLGLSLYQIFLVWTYRRHRGPDPQPRERWSEDELPRVTVQLPCYNEGELGVRIARLAADLDYPIERLQIQFLDDSTDPASSAMAIEAVEQLRAEKPGLDIQYITRPDRKRFKAGSLAVGTAQATGEFIAIFDADFMIPRDFLRNTLHHFTDAQVGVVQARWSYYNRYDSFFTRLQAEKLDTHQMFDQTARGHLGFAPIFHGTAGVWRAKTIEEAGGWDVDCEVEDVWLTIHAVSLGYRFVYLDHLRIESELPETMLGFIVQRMRWKRGWTQIAGLLTKKMLTSKLPLVARLDILIRFHATWGNISGIIITFGILPYFMAAAYLGLMLPATVGYLLLLALNLAIRIMEAKTLSQDAATDPSPKLLPWPMQYAPLGYILDMGMNYPMMHATIEAIRGKRSWAVTPKKGSLVSGAEAGGKKKKTPAWIWGAIWMGAAAVALTVVSGLYFHPLAAAFYIVQAAGCFWVGVQSLIEFRAAQSPSPSAAVMQPPKAREPIAA
jgi:cellulose synthase/poly-beta-1,6-N-acetylglucosamine synthase-like glycosyltransferase